MRKWMWSLALTLVMPASLLAGSVDTPNGSAAAAAFERLKSLAGTWQVDGSMGKGQSIYEVVANGSTVIERFTHDGMPSPMITAYHLNGDKLEAAKQLGIGKTTLYRKLKEYGATV